ncbi:MAG: hypothetical protein JWO05_3328 [Gemmatimonadetes bacterium]|nr:hypothetical protein [Gemmatimonadota bacterium]
MFGDIFVQVAAYRDPDLGPTLRDAVARATDPSRLRFCIAWQHGDDESYESVFGDLAARVRLDVLDIPYEESRGACWARHRIQQRYEGEAYTLQIDSHHRFVDGWDDLCIGMITALQDAGIPKPLLTTYLPSFDPLTDPEGRTMRALELSLDRFIPEGAVFVRGAPMRDWETRSHPSRGRFYSAHFAFTIGQFAREVQHDPSYYFHGEEINITVRAFTHGYDLFHPHRLVAWHEYTRRGRTKHWDDHRQWSGLNLSSHEHNRRLFGMDEFESQPALVSEAQASPFGFGTVRTLEDYERYAGICFQRRGVTTSALENREPSPDDNQDVSYEVFAAGCIPRFKHCIDLDRRWVPLTDYDFWCVAFHDAAGRSLHRQDIDEAEIAALQGDADGKFQLWRSFDTEILPASWSVWPHSRSAGWCAPIVGHLR